MKPTYILGMAALCLLAISCKNEPVIPKQLSAIEQFANQYLEDKEKDYATLEEEWQTLESNWKGDDEALEKAFIEKEDAFDQKWEDELLRRLDENPEWADAKALTKILIDYDDNLCKAREEFEKTLKAQNEEIFQDEFAPFDCEWEGKFITLVSENPALLEYPGALINDLCGFDVCTSPDGLLRYYCWNTGRGGSMLNIGQFCQYRGADGMVHVPMAEKVPAAPQSAQSVPEEETNTFGGSFKWEAMAFVTNIDELDTDDRKIYLVEEFFQISAALQYSTLKAVVIAGNELQDVAIFDNGKEGIVDKLKTAFVENSFVYNEKDKTLTVEQYEEKDEPDDDGWFTKIGTIKYVFNGKVFKKK